MTLLRRVLGDTLRGQRLHQQRTLREVSGAARVSLGYLSEVERGQKEASSELLASICDALDVRLSEVLREVSDTMRRSERGTEVARAPARQLVPAGAAGPGRAPAPAELPINHDGAEFAVDLDLPPDFDRGELVDRVGLEPVRRGGPGATRGDGETFDTAELDTDLDAAGLDPGRLDPDSLDPDSLDPGRLDPDSLDRDSFEVAGFAVEVPSELDQTGLDGVDLAELETGDELGDVDALLSLTELSCSLDRPHGAPSCLAGAVAAA